MADNITLNAGTGGAVVATDDDATAHHQYVKLEFGPDGTFTKVAEAAPLPVKITDGTDDALVDASGNLNVILASNSGVDIGDVDILSIAAGDNNIGNVDVVTLPALPAGTNNIGDVDVLSFPTTVHSEDFDTGVGTDTTLALGIAVPASGGAVVVPGDTTNGLDVDVTRVTGTVTVDGSAVTQPVSHAALTALDAAISTEVQVDVVAALPAGTNNIGDVDVLTLPALPAGTNNIGDVDILTIAAGDNNIGNVDVVTLPALPAGTNNIGDVDVLSIADGDNNIGNVDVVTLPALPAGTNNIGDVDVLSIAAGTNTIGNVVPVPATSGGLTIFRSLDLDESEEEVKATAGQVYGVWVTNTSTTTRWLKFYNATAANVTVGSTTPVITIGIPGNSSDDISGMFMGTQGIAFGTAITVAATTGVADADTGAPAANDVIVNIFYA